MGVTFCAVAAEHPSRCTREGRPRARAFIDECAAQRDGGRPRDDGQEGHAHGLSVTTTHGAQVEVWVGNYVLMATATAGDGLGARRARLRVREEVRAADPAGGWPSRASRSPPTPGSPGTRQGRGRCVNSAGTTVSIKAAVDAIAADLAAQGLGEKKVTFRCETGASPGSATGARRFDHPLWRLRPVPVPDRDLPSCCRKTACRRQRNPLAKPRTSSPSTAGVRQAGAARDRHDGHVRRLVLVLHALRVPDATAMVDRATTTGCRWTSTSAASARDPAPALRAFWTKVMRDMGLVQFDEPFTRLLTQAWC